MGWLSCGAVEGSVGSALSTCPIPANVQLAVLGSVATFGT
jgi:hypothetical protein